MTSTPRFDPAECVDGPDDCSGEVRPYLSQTGSGLKYLRCKAHAERLHLTSLN